MGCSGEKVTSSSGSPAIERTALDTARLKGSVGFSFLTVTAFAPALSGHQDLGGGFRQLNPEAALVELSDSCALELVALVEEGHTEAKTDVAEDGGVLGPGDYGARAHHGRDVAIDEGVTRH